MNDVRLGTSPLERQRTSSTSTEDEDDKSVTKLSSLSDAEVLERLQSVDPASARRIHPKDGRKLRRYSFIDLYFRSY